MSKRKMMVIGIDGATNDILRPMMAAGRLPNIARLVENGVHSDLRSTIPPLTMPAWVTSVTGVNPGRLGLFFFFNDLHNYMSRSPVSTGDVRSRFVWDLMGEAGRRSLLVSIPRMYPPVPVEGVMVSYLQGADAQVRTFPEERLESLARAIDLDEMMRAREEFNRIFSERRMDLARRELDYFLFFNRMATEKQAAACCELMATEEWDFLMTVFSVTDLVQHKFWRFRDPDNPAYDPELAAAYGEAIEQSYEWADRAVGQLLERAGEDVACMLVSDHGFNSLHHIFRVNQWLARKGFLHFRDVAPRRVRRRVPLQRILGRVGLGAVARRLPGRLRQLGVPVWRRQPVPFDQRVDWSRTRAYYSPSSYALNVNLAGREPQGCVDPGDYEATVEELRSALLAEVHPRDGKPLLAAVREKREIYSGEHVERAGDLYLEFRDRTCISSGELGEDGQVIRPISAADKISGTHQSNREGIFVFCGPGVKPGVRDVQPGIEDVTPTALHMVGVPVPASMDGRVLTECLTEAFLAERPVARGEGDLAVEGGAPGQGVDEDEQERIAAKLRDLGYIE